MYVSIEMHIHGCILFVPINPEYTVTDYPNCAGHFFSVGEESRYNGRNRKEVELSLLYVHLYWSINC